jgi:plastocyanin
MRPRKPHLMLLALLGVAAAMLPAIASSETPPKVEATQTGMEGIYAIYSWLPSETTIGAAGAVTFSSGPSTSVEHGIVWLSGPATPVCDSSVPVGAEHFRANWSGSCTFAQPGTYRFRCSFHEYMKGTIVVTAGGTTTTTTTTSTQTQTSTTPSGTPPPAKAKHPTLTRAQKLAKALKACKHKPKGKRAACRKRARKRFGAHR